MGSEQFLKGGRDRQVDGDLRFREIEERGIAAAIILTQQDRAIFKSLGKESRQVSASTIGAPLERGKFNIRLPIKPVGMDVISKAEVIYVGCADERLTEVQAKLATNGKIDKVLPVLLAGGVVQPGNEEIDAPHLDTSFTNGVAREPLLWNVLDYLIAARLRYNPRAPLTVIYGAHDKKCAFVAKIFNGSLTVNVDRAIADEAMLVHQAGDDESAVMMNTAVSHASEHKVPEGVETQFCLFSLRQDGNNWRVELVPIAKPDPQRMRRMSRLSKV